MKSAKHPVAKILGFAFNWIIEILDSVFQYIVVNAYVVLALEGTPFYKSGKRAVDLLKNNFVEVIKLWNVGTILMLVGNGIILLAAYVLADYLISVSCNIKFTKKSLIHVSF